EQAVIDLIGRLLPSRVDEFDIKVTPFLLENDCKDKFIIEPLGLRIRIVATSGVAAANGLRYYLKEYCKCHVSWSGNQLSVPVPLPQPNMLIMVVIQDKLRYYQNVCTQSYSFVWWDWKRWEREIDYMAMLGINTALMFTAQEYFWKKVYLNFNLTENEINDFFTGPAFLAWNRMGNLQKWAGPPSDFWHENQLSLAKKIVKRMRSFGMLTVFPAFAAHVPRNITRVYPNASITYLSSWVGFNCTYSCTAFLEPDDPLFGRIGSAFVKEYIKEFGTDHIYNTDLFNEMTPKTSDPSYLRKCGKAVFRSLIEADPYAIWMMQGWLFVNDPAFWLRPQAEALLTSSELNPQYTRFNGYFGQPFIWNMLHNFGGVLGLYGTFDAINENLFEARRKFNSSMIGVGLTPEGIEQNDIMYHFMMETIWHKNPIDVDQWILKYIGQRHGTDDERIRLAYLLLRQQVYDAKPPVNDHERYILPRRPSLNLRNKMWFNTRDVIAAWSLMVNASYNPLLYNSTTFRYDLIDIGREVFQLMHMSVYFEIVDSFRNENISALSTKAKLLMEILKDANVLMSTNENFLLGKWIKAAKQLASNEKESELFEFNAKNQITLWGPKGEIVDYATKQWAGIFSDYYYPRWKLFVETLIDCLLDEKTFNERQFHRTVLKKVELPFCEKQKIFPSFAIGDEIKVSRMMYAKYFDKSLF
ncbi:alpha-N-acetylglucosaminidase-like protein, partial [Dinothrombium tinctorium]